MIVFFVCCLSLRCSIEASPNTQTYRCEAPKIQLVEYKGKRKSQTQSVNVTTSVAVSIQPRIVKTKIIKTADSNSGIIVWMFGTVIPKVRLPGNVSDSIFLATHTSAGKDRAVAKQFAKG